MKKSKIIVGADTKTVERKLNELLKTAKRIHSVNMSIKQTTVEVGDKGEIQNISEFAVLVIYTPLISPDTAIPTVEQVLAQSAE